MDAFEYLAKNIDHDDWSILEIKGFVKGWAACLEHKKKVVDSGDSQNLIYGLSSSQILFLKHNWMKNHGELPED